MQSNGNGNGHGSPTLLAVGERLACSGCGTMFEAPEFSELWEELEAARKLITRQERTIRRLRAEGDRQLRGHPCYEDAIKVLEHWREKCAPGAKQLEGGGRLANVIARLEGKDAFSVEECLRCIDGYARFPYVTSHGRQAQGSKSDRHDDAELIFRNPQKVQRGLQLAERADMQDNPPCEALRPNEPDRSSGPPRSPSESRESGPPLAGLSLSPQGQAAVEYAKHGWLVFPCRRDAKEPASRNGFYDATCDVGRIERYWAEAGDANVAIRTGAESGLVVLDVDSEEGFETLRAGCRKLRVAFPRTYSVKTPRGGSHFYFAHPGHPVFNTNGWPGKGIDIRGDLGYVLAPPSVVNGRPYAIDEECGVADFPDWLLTAVLKRQRKIPHKIDPAQYERLMAAGVREGERNSKLTSMAGHLWSHGLTPGEVLGFCQLVNRERCDPPLAPHDVLKIVQSVARMRARQA